MSFQSLLTKDAQIQSKTFTQGDDGSLAETWTTVTTVKTRYEQNSSPKIEHGVYVTNVDDYMFYFDINVALERSQRLVCEGKSFDVLGVYVNQGLQANHHLEVLARVVDGL